MKPEFDSKYFKISLYIFGTLIATYIGITLIQSIPFAFTRLLSFLNLLISMLTPALFGFIFAYLLYGPTRAIEKFLSTRKRFPLKSKVVARMIGIAVSYLCVIGLLISIILGIYYMIGGSLSKNTTFAYMINSIVTHFENQTLSPDSLKETIGKLNLPFMDIVNNRITDIAIWIQGFTTSLVTYSVNSVVAIGKNIFTFLVAFILSIYFLTGAEYFIALFDKLFFVIFRKSKTGKTIKQALSIVNDTFSNYITGQLIEAFLVGILSTIALLIIGVDYAIIIGIIAGITNLIPYVGPLIGTALAAIISLLDGDIAKCIGVIIGMQIVQQIDNNILAPKIVGDRVGLHPAFVVIAILIGGNQAGLLGMLMAVPIAASMKALLSNWFRNTLYNEYKKYKKNK